jgi:dTDP-4-amino-4,6-dideoxygalactose transaminase
MSGAELELVEQAFASNYVAPLGPMVDAFEREFAEYTGIPHCLALASGTAAMHLALRELGVGPGDLVLASTLTFIGSVNAATYQGAQLAFLDAHPDTWNLDPALLAEELADCARRGRLPKAVIPTDLYGQSCDLDELTRICAPYGIPVISDAAEAMGAKYWGEAESRKQKAESPERAATSANSSFELPSSLDIRHSSLPGASSAAVPESAGKLAHAGYGGKAAVFSFNGNKIITTSGGGMLASHDPDLIAHARKLSTQARDPAPHYEHTEIGYNYRMSNIVAAIGRGQLRVLDQRVERKRGIFAAYQQRLGDLPGITFMPEAPTGRCNRWLTVILIDPAQFGATTGEVRLALEADNIEARPVWKPMHLQPVFKGCHIRGGAVSERLFRDGLCLPSGTAMTDSDLDRITTLIRRCHRPS